MKYRHSLIGTLILILDQQRVESRINEIRQNLPAGINISVEKMNPSIFPIMGFSLEGKGFSQIELRNIAEYSIKPFLSRIDGVSEVAVAGGEVEESCDSRSGKIKSYEDFSSNSRKQNIRI